MHRNWCLQWNFQWKTNNFFWGCWIFLPAINATVFSLIFHFVSHCAAYVNVSLYISLYLCSILPGWSKRQDFIHYSKMYWSFFSIHTYSGILSNIFICHLRSTAFWKDTFFSEFEVIILNADVLMFAKNIGMFL